MPTIRISMEAIEDPSMDECLDALRTAAETHGWDCLEAAHIQKKPHLGIMEWLAYDLGYADLYRSWHPDTDICAYIKCFHVGSPEIGYYKIITVGLAGKNTDWTAILWHLEDSAPGTVRDDIIKASEFLERKHNQNKKASKRPEEYAGAAEIIFEGLLSVFTQSSASRRH